MACCFTSYMYVYDKKFCDLTGYPFQSRLSCYDYQRYIPDPDDDDSDDDDFPDDLPF